MAQFVHHRHHKQVVFFHQTGNFVGRVGYLYRMNIGIVNLLDGRFGGCGQQAFERQPAFEPALVVHHINGVHASYVFGLAAHFRHGTQHIPVFVYLHKLLAHQTAGGVFVVAKQVHNVLGVFGIFDTGDNLLLLFFGQVGNQVGGLVGFQFLYDIRNFVARQAFENIFPLVVVQFGHHIGGCFVGQKPDHIHGLAQGQTVHHLGNIGRVQVANAFQNGCIVAAGNELAQFLDDMFNPVSAHLRRAFGRVLHNPPDAIARLFGPKMLPPGLCGAS